MKKVLAIGFCFALFGLFYWPFAIPASQGNAETEIAYVGEARCKMCHNRADSGLWHDNWAESHHAKVMDLLSEEEKNNPDCLRCHTTGYGKQGGFISLAETPRMANVQCEACHGPGGEHVQSAMRNLNNPELVTPMPGRPTASTCQKCHNEESPTWDPNRYVDEDGNASGFNYKMAFEKAAHTEVYQALDRELPTPLEDED